MKKLFTSLALSALSIGAIFAQLDTTGGPDAYGYSWITSDDPGAGAPTYSWLDITSSGTEVMGFVDDNIMGPFDIGFDFPFYWYTATKFSIGSNGYIQFEDVPYNISSDNYGAAGNESFPGLPYNDPQGNANNMLAPMMCDLNPTGSAKIYYYSNGTDSLIISYEEVGFWSSGTEAAGSNTFQVIITSDGGILFQYKEQSGSWNATYDASPNPVVVGIESKAGQAGLTVSNSNKPQPNTAVRFTLSKDPTFSITDVSLDWQKNESNGAIFAIVDEPTYINVNVSNVGDSDINSDITVTTKIEKYFEGNLNSTNIFTPEDGNSFTMSSLTAANASEYVYDEPLVPVDLLNSGQPGSYVISSATTFLDGNSANNTVETEMVILNNNSLDSVALNYHDRVADGGFGFNSGGVYIALPKYPVYVRGIEFFVIQGAVEAPNTGVFVNVYALDGSGNIGDLVFDTYVAPESIEVAQDLADDAPPTYVDISKIEGNPVYMHHKGFYVSVTMGETDNGGAPVTPNFTLALDGTYPFSLRSFEVQSGAFAAYRSAASGDPMIGAVVNFEPQTKQTGIEDEITKVELGNAYPNPASGMTSIDFTLAETSKTVFTLSNMIGQRIETQNFGSLSSGKHQVRFDASDLESGIYFYTLEVGNEKLTKKLIVK